MKVIHVIETAKELFDLKDKHRPVGDTAPILQNDATLVFEDNMNEVLLQNADGFKLSDEVAATDILTESITRNGFKIHIT